VLNKQQFYLLSALACVALILAIIDMFLVTANRSTQDEYNARARYIQQSLQVEPVYKDLIRALAELSARQNDPQLRELLLAQGITFSVASPAAAQSAGESKGANTVEVKDASAVEGNRGGGGK
jgi:hypothetical protein